MNNQVPATLELCRTALSLYGRTNLHIEPEAKSSTPSEHGTWVQAWVWVPNYYDYDDSKFL